MARQQGPTKVNLLRGLEDDERSVGEKRLLHIPAVSKGVRKVPSLLFDIDLEDTEEVTEEHLEDVAAQIDDFVKPQTALERQIADRVQRIQKQVVVNSSSRLEAEFLARRLDYPGYVFKIRTALGGTCAGSSLRQLRHFFLTCSSKEDPETVCCVIDPMFREQFEIANPSQRYAKLLRQLPAEIVLAEERLASLINLLSSEMKQSFQATGTTLPPWRHPSSLMSKWRPRRSVDTCVHPLSAASKPLTMEKRQTETKAGRVSAPSLEAFKSASEWSGGEGGPTPGHHSKPQVKTGFVASPPQEVPSALSSKRNRDLGPLHSTYSSVLASKLRGVSTYDFSLSSAIYPSKGQA